MAHNVSRRKWPPSGFPAYKSCDDKRRSRLVGERHILELISLGAPLAGILNKLCTVIDAQIGNVVSLVLLADVEECHLASMSQSAVQFGLNGFSSTNIYSHDKRLLGTLQIYCCDQRRPAPHEFQLIERVNRLAAVALQLHKDAEKFEGSGSHWSSARDGSAPERPPFIN
ncbi:MAG: hypothetical protein ACRD41_05020 [Candidatus Acidiferrales bacterium]